MASISLSQKRASVVGSWSSWASMSGSDPVCTTFYDYVVYKATVNYSGATAYQSVKVGIPIGLNTAASRSCSITAYLYTSDPSGSYSAPSGYIASKVLSTSISGSTAIKYLEFTGLNLTATTIYIWFNVAYDTYDDGIVAYAYHGSATITGTPKSNPVMSLSFSGTTNGITVTVANGSGKALVCTFTADNGQQLAQSNSFTTGSVFIQYDLPTWFNKANVTDSTYLHVNVSVTGGNPNPLTGSFTLNATGNESIKPVVGTPTKTLVQPSSAITQDYPSTYIANVSKCKVTVAITRPTNAAIDDDRVYLSRPGGTTIKMTRVGTSDTFEGTSPVPGDVTFTVTVTDVRGCTASNTVELTGVVPYTKPYVTVNYCQRCDSLGAEESGGTHYKIRVTAHIDTGLTGNSVTLLAVGFLGEDPRYRHNLTSGTTGGPYSGCDQPNRTYRITVVIKDKISGEVESEYKLPGKQRDFVLSHVGGKTHLGIGTTPGESNNNTVELPADGDFLIGGTPAQAYPIPYSDDTSGASFGKDFTSIDVTNRKATTNATAMFFYDSTGATSFAEMPSDRSSGWAGMRQVLILNTDYAMVIVYEILPLPGRIWMRLWRSAGSPQWSDWRYHPPTAAT